MIVRVCTHPAAVVGDLKKAFWQVCTSECDHDILDMFPLDATPGEHSEIETLGFT